MSQPRDPRETSARVEQLLADLGAHADPRVAERAGEVVRLLMELYGTALARVMEIAASEPAASEPAASEPGASEPGGGPHLVDRLAGDELVASLLILHGLHPLSTTERVRRALESVRPYLGSHAGGVQFLGVDGDVVNLRLQGSCDGCPSSTITVKNAIERAISETAPEITEVRVEGVTGPGPAQPAHTGLIPVESLYRDRPPAPLPDLGDLGPGELRAVDVAGSRVLFCRAGGDLYAYRDSCPSCGSAMAGGELDGDLAGCPACQRRYNVRQAGRSVEDRDVHLDPLPLITRNGTTRVSLPAGAPSAGAPSAVVPS